jgi:hypothetical protein
MSKRNSSFFDEFVFLNYNLIKSLLMAIINTAISRKGLATYLSLKEDSYVDNSLKVLNWGPVENYIVNNSGHLL